MGNEETDHLARKHCRAGVGNIFVNKGAIKIEEPLGVHEEKIKSSGCKKNKNSKRKETKKMGQYFYHVRGLRVHHSHMKSALQSRLPWHPRVSFCRPALEHRNFGAIFRIHVLLTQFSIS